MATTFDILIAGGGGSGWSLLWALIQLDLDSRFTIGLIENIDPDAEKTWSFWETETSEGLPCTYTSWKQLAYISNEGRTKVERIPYYSIRSSDFINAIRTKAESKSNISLIKDRITDFNPQKKQIKGHTKTYEAELLFINFVADDIQKQTTAYPLLQHFGGLVVESNKLDLNPEQATFMDFRVNQSHGFAFMYVLPYAKNKALFEYTLFSAKPLTKEEYLQEVWLYLRKFHSIDPSSSDIIEEEFGHIPMDDRLPIVKLSKGVYQMGSVAGMTKASTGYTFSRIQKAARAVARQLSQTSKLQALEISLLEGCSKTKYRLYDIVLLDVLSRNADVAQKAFEKFFNALGIEKMLRFLSEKSPTKDEIKILYTAPRMPFIRSVWQAKSTLLRHIQHKN